MTSLLSPDSCLLTPVSSSDVEAVLARAWQSRRASWPDEIIASLPVDTLPVSVTGRSCALDCAHCGGHYLAAMKCLEAVLARAWQSRRANWPDEIIASLPVDTLPVSVTGRSCALDCAHCGGHYLAAMKSIEEARRSPAASLLISGGCDARGRVPVGAHLAELAVLAAGRRTNWHLGLVGDEEARALRPLLDVVSFDFVGDDETLREVYGLEATVDDYERSLERLLPLARVVPHVTIGLRGGKLGHELAAFERLARYRFDSLVLLVLVPTPGTRYADVEPPPLGEVGRIMAEARLRFPGTSLQLGCMRPQGAYRQALDVLAVRAGMNVIVNPTRPAYAEARERGLRWNTMHECCVFAP